MIVELTATKRNAEAICCAITSEYISMRSINRRAILGGIDTAKLEYSVNFLTTLKWRHEISGKTTFTCFKYGTLFCHQLYIQLHIASAMFSADSSMHGVALRPFRS